MVHKTKFKDNARLFQNKDELSNEKDSDEEENKFSIGDNWSKFKGNIQGDSDDDDQAT